MRYEPYPQYTSKWVNVCMDKTLTSDQIEWILVQPGGRFHIHNSQHAIKFERSQDAAWFLLRWR